MTIEDLDLYDHYPRLRAAKARETTVPETPRAQPMTMPTETPTPGEARSVEAIGAFGFIDSEPDNRDAVVGEIAVRLGVKPWEMGHFRHRYTNGVEDLELINLRALTRLGAVKNEADLLSWSLKSDGVGGGPT